MRLASRVVGGLKGRSEIGEERADRIACGVGMSTTIREVAADRRARLLAAFSKAAAEDGYARLDIHTVARYAGVDVAAFDQEFETKERALVAAQEIFLEGLWIEVLAAAEGPGEWAEKVRAALSAALASLVELGTVARVFTVEATAASFAAADRQYVALEAFASLLREGRRRYPRADSLPFLTERLLVGGVASIISAHLMAEDLAALPALEPELVETLLAPYLGESEARRIAAS